MMPTDRFERQLTALLTELAEPRTPEYFDDLMALTARTRQRAAWTFIERWLPLAYVARQRVTAAPIPWRTIGIVALVVLGLALGAALVIGSQPRVPAPFGPARNGAVAFARDGDILIVDPVTNDAHMIVGGPDLDLDPVFSLQGTQVAFLRSDPGNGDRLMVADTSGSNVTEVTGPYFGISGVAWSPDGSTLAFASSVHGFPTITLAAADGSGTRDLDLGMPAEAPTWRPTGGNELLFRGASPSGSGLYLMNGDGSNVRSLELGSDISIGLLDFYGAAWSPDGTRLTFHNWNTLADRLPSERYAASRLHVAEIAADGTVTSDRVLDIASRTDDESWARWSPDGRYLLFQHGFDNQIEPMIATADGTWGPIRVGRVRPNQTATSGTLPSSDAFPSNPNGIGFEWAPDGTSIIAFEYVDDSTWFLDPTGLPGTQVHYGTGRTPSWQRLAR
jgi:Tol biopolymer transport system component